MLERVMPVLGDNVKKDRLISGTVWKDWREALGGRAVSKKKEEEEGDLLGAFFYRVYEFLFTFPNPPPVIHRPHIPERYAIRFVPATGVPVLPQPVFVPAELPPFVAANPVSPALTDFSVVSSANFVVNASPVTDYSVISSVNFTVPSPVIDSPCIEPNT